MSEKRNLKNLEIKLKYIEKLLPEEIEMYYRREMKWQKEVHPNRFIQPYWMTDEESTMQDIEWQMDIIRNELKNEVIRNAKKSAERREIRAENKRNKETTKLTKEAEEVDELTGKDALIFVICMFLLIMCVKALI
jgi:hypothetical protein